MDESFLGRDISNFYTTSTVSQQKVNAIVLTTLPYPLTFTPISSYIEPPRDYHLLPAPGTPTCLDHGTRVPSSNNLQQTLALEYAVQDAYSLSPPEPSTAIAEKHTMNPFHETNPAWRPQSPLRNKCSMARHQQDPWALIPSEASPKK